MYTIQYIRTQTSIFSTTCVWFKHGRQGDFCVSCPSTALEVRQVQKQARRIQAYVRTLGCSFFGPVQRAKCVELWTAILRSSGFKPCFPTWALNELGISLSGPLDNDDLATLLSKVQNWAQKLASRRWQVKRHEFALQVDASWKAKGGRIPFALLREKPLPPVTDLRVQLEVRLAPQRWSPVGKAWFTILNVSDFGVGDCLSSDDLSVKILEIRDEYIHVDRLLSRRQASRLRHSRPLTQMYGVHTLCKSGLHFGMGIWMMTLLPQMSSFPCYRSAPHKGWARWLGRTGWGHWSVPNPTPCVAQTPGAFRNLRSYPNPWSKFC